MAIGTSAEIRHNHKVGESVRFEARLLGPFQLKICGKDAPPLRARTAQAVLVSLILAGGREHDREHLAFQLWPDSYPEQALGNLRQNIFSLRKSLGQEAWRIGSPDRRRISFDLSASVIDIVEFDDLARSSHLDDWRRAVEIYAGPLLPGSTMEWICDERDRRQRVFETLLERVIERMGAGGEERYANELLRLDPCNEIALRGVLDSRASSRDVPGIIRSFDAYRRSLKRLYGQVPSDKLVAVYRDSLDRAKATFEVKFRRWTPGFLGEFRGREAESRALAALLAQNRCVTVTGEPGIGKSRLVAEVLNRSNLAGMWLDGANVERSAAEQLGVSPDQIREALRARANVAALQIVIDHAGASVIEFIRTYALFGGLRFVITAREPLAIPGETNFRLGPLDSQDSAQWLRQHHNLFNDAEVESLARASGGHPLALDLICQLATSTSPQIVLGAIQRAGLMGLDANGSLRSAFELAWQRLSDREQMVVSKVSALAGEIDAEFALKIGIATSELDALVSRGWLIANSSPSGTWYQAGMLAAEFVGAPSSEIDDQVIESALERAFALQDQLHTSSSAIAHDALRRCRSTFDRIYEVATDRRRFDYAGRLLSATWAHWLSLGDIQQTFERVGRCLSESGYSTGDRVRLKNAHGFLRRGLGEMDWAIAVHREALELAFDSGSVALVAESRARLALALANAGQPQSAVLEYRRALTEFQDAGARWWQSTVRFEWATVLLGLGDVEGAETQLAAAEHIMRQVGDPSRMGLILQARAKLFARRGDFQDARQCLEQAAELFREVGFRRNYHSILVDVARLDVQERRFEEAEAHYRAAIGLVEELNFRPAAIESHLELAELYLATGRVVLAEDEFVLAKSLANETARHSRVSEAEKGIERCRLASFEFENLTEDGASRAS